MQANNFSLRRADAPRSLVRSSDGARLQDTVVSSDVPTILVVDDDCSLGDWLQPLILGEGWRLEIFVSAAGFLARPRTRVPTCLVLEVEVPDLDGLQLQQQLAARIDLPIIFLTGCRDVHTSVQAMKAGAFDFLTKPATPDEMLCALRQALDRSRVVLREQAEMEGLRDCYASLTPREREVIALVVSGLLNKQIAGELGISEITVKAHRGQVMRKMKADSVAELVMMANRLGVRRVTRH